MNKVLGKIKRYPSLWIILGSFGIGLLFTLMSAGAFTVARQYLHQYELSVTDLARYNSIINGQEDVGLYYKYAQTMKAGYTPYKDFAIEYPPGAIALLMAPALFTNDPIYYQFMFSLEMALFAGGSALLIWRYIKENRPDLLKRTTKYFLIATLLCGTLLVARYDAAAAFLLVMTTYFVLKDKPALAGFAAGVGFSTKLYPILVIAPYGLYLLSNKRWQDTGRLIVAFGLITAAIFIPALLASPGGVLRSFTYHTGRGLQIESVMATGHWLYYSLTHKAWVGWGYGSINLVGKSPDIAAKIAFYMFFLVTAVLLAIWFVRLIRHNNKSQTSTQKSKYPAKAMYLIALTITFGFVVFNKVFSPQYMIWIAFMCALGVCYLPKKWFYWLFVSQALTILIFPLNYAAIMNTDHLAVNILIIRNIIVFCMWIWLAKQSITCPLGGTSEKLAKTTAV